MWLVSWCAISETADLLHGISIYNISKTTNLLHAYLHLLRTSLGWVTGI